MNLEVYYDDYGEESDADSTCADSDGMDRFPDGASITMPWWDDEVFVEVW